jgi:diguanylate cyclase (GGDEF)-like protein/PAS domain S-box-containing protein
MERSFQFLAAALGGRSQAEGSVPLHLALNNISQGVCFFDGAHRLIICNDRYIEMYRLPPARVRPGVLLQEIVDLRFEAGSFPDMTREQYLAWRESIVTSNKASDTTVELKDGRVFEIRHRPMPNGGWVATHEDITEQRRREESFRLLFDSNPMPMWLIDLETLGFLAVNDAAVAHYGYTREAFAQMRAPELRFAGDQESSNRFLLTGEMSQGLRVWRHRKASGEAILVSIYARNLQYAGRAARLCTVLDVTERTRSEDKLLEQKVQIDTAVNNMSQGLLMFDAAGRLVLCNRRYMEMYSLSPEVVKPGCTLRQLVEHRRELGLFTGNPEEYCRGILESVAQGDSSTLTTELADGRSVEVINRPMPGGGWVVTHEDVTERKRAEMRIARESNEHRRLFEMSQDIIIVTDRRGIVLRVSPILKSILGYGPEEWIGASAARFVHPDDLDETRKEMRLARKGQHTRNCETRYLHKDGRIVTLAWSGVWSEPEQMHFFTCRDVSERRIIDEKLKYLAHYDQLTGLPNRASLLNDLNEQLDAKASCDRRPTAIAMIDLDGFKDVNDTLGHSIGDQLLQEVARRMSDAVGNARIYRLGGDEFVVLLAGCGDPRSIAQLVDAVVMRVGESFVISNHRLFIGASAGIAMAPADGSNVEELISNADLALYDAKANGGRGYRLFQPTMRARAQARRELDMELRRAWSDNEFVLYYQPQVRLSDGAVVGAEALLRWRHPQQGILAPGAFIDALADSPVVLEVGRWILHTACQRAVSWRAKGIAPLRIGVNLFPAQFTAKTLLQDVETALLESSLPPDALEIEITENIALAQDDTVLAPLRSLRAKGVNFAFDDFGTGYASLSFLARYPLTRLKIDQSFVRKIADSFTPRDTAIIRSIIVMAHNLGLEVIAEGVETPAQAAFLLGEKCDEVQGYLYARPLPAAEFEDFLLSNAQTVRGRATRAAS